MPRLRLQKKAKEANETGSTEEILVEEAASTESSPGDDDIVKKIPARLSNLFGSMAPA